jgi:peptidoglycan/LPS O-acetylase OafA/YrhL
MTKSSGPARLDFIEGMRAAAALVVVVNHAYGQVWAPFYGQFPRAPFGFLTYSLAIGHLAVSVFISISGFCLMLPVVRNAGQLSTTPAQFFQRRARRILPPYYAALCLSLLLIYTVIGQPTHTIWDVPIAVRPTDIASHLLLLQDFFGTGKINYAFWSIALEWQIYFLFPLLVLLFRRRPLLTVVGALCAGYATLLIPEARVARANLHYLGLFALGMAAAWVAFSAQAERLRSRLPYTALGVLCAAAAVALLPAFGWEGAIRHWPLLDLLVGAATCCALVHACAHQRSPARVVFAARPLAFVGRFSYSLYLIHAPLLALFWIHLVRYLPLSDLVRFCVLLFGGGGLVVLASWLFYLAFEAPFVRPASARPRPQVVLPPAA